MIHPKKLEEDQNEYTQQCNKHIQCKCESEILQKNCLRRQELGGVCMDKKLIQINSLIHHDEQTNLPTRIFLKHFLHEQISKRDGSDNLVCILIDIDRFRWICDIFGDVISNEVLCTVARRLNRVAGGAGFVARWETGAFVIIIDGLESRKRVEEMAEEVLFSLKMPINSVNVINHDFYLTASIGLAFFPEDGRDPVSLVRSAQVAMRKAKGLGGNAFRFHTQEMKAQAATEVEVMEKGLRKALKEQQFNLHYQPQINLKTGNIDGLEALLRWRHPEKGLMLPQKFISLAEETDLIIPISEWVLQTACEQNKKWQAAGHTPVRMAVNIPVRLFQHSDFPNLVQKVLESAGLNPQWLELEITENNPMGNGEEVVKILHRLKNLGVQIAIDDFGSGYSSLTYIKIFPIDILKLDRFFIREVTTSARNAAIVRSIFSMAESMGIKTIAEGIETENQLSFLRKEGCALGQGFLLGRPEPAGKWTRELSQQSIQIRR